MSVPLAALMNWAGGVGAFVIQAPWVSLAGLAMILASRVSIRLIDRLPEIMRAWTEHCRQIPHTGRPAASHTDPPARVVAAVAAVQPIPAPIHPVVAEGEGMIDLPPSPAVANDRLDQVARMG